jgi:hypothetical protein
MCAGEELHGGAGFPGVVEAVLVLVECPAEERGMFSVGGDATFMGRVYRLLVKGASRTFRGTVRVK